MRRGPGMTRRDPHPLARAQSFPAFVTGLQIKAARALLDWTQADLAEAGGFSTRNIGNLENNRGQERYVLKYMMTVVATLEDAGIAFISDEKKKLTGVVFVSKEGEGH